MKSNFVNRKDLLSHIDNTPGWFQLIDQILFAHILEFYEGIESVGDVLEIGVYKGKSAILLSCYLPEYSDLYLCDVFDKQTTQKNQEEIMNDYDHYTKADLLKTIKKYSTRPPIVIDKSSLELPKLLDGKQFTFIHVDGSHIYEIVSQDVAFVTGGSLIANGIVVFDDYRSVHTIGVSAAVWESIIHKKLKPIFRTENKMYCVNNKLNDIEVNKITGFIQNLDLDFVVDDFLGMKSLFIKKF